MTEQESYLSNLTQVVRERLNVWTTTHASGEEILTLLNTAENLKSDSPATTAFARELLAQLSRLDNGNFLQENPDFMDATRDYFTFLLFCGEVAEKPETDSIAHLPLSEELIEPMRQAEAWLSRQQCYLTTAGERVYSSKVFQAACPELPKPNIYYYIQSLDLPLVPLSDVLGFTFTRGKPPSFFSHESVLRFLIKVVYRLDPPKTSKPVRQYTETTSVTRPKETGHVHVVKNGTVKMIDDFEPDSIEPRVSLDTIFVPTLDDSRSDAQRKRNYAYPRRLVKPTFKKRVGIPNSSDFLYVDEYGRPIDE